MADMIPLCKVFEISRGSKLNFNKMKMSNQGNDAIAFVGRSGSNNGFSGWVERIDDKEPYQPGLITVALGGSLLSSFVQHRMFYTGQNIDVLRPRESMSVDVKLYYCLCIQANKFRYSTYGREANRTLHKIEVPARNMVPQWVEGSVKDAVDGLSLKLQTAMKQDLI